MCIHSKTFKMPEISAIFFELFEKGWYNVGEKLK